jgi:hypothetical protein
MHRPNEINRSLKHPAVTASTFLPSACKYKSRYKTAGWYNIIIRSGGGVYQHKTNALTYLGVKINDLAVVRPDGNFCKCDQ